MSRPSPINYQTFGMEILFNFIAFFLFIAFISTLIKKWKGSEPVHKLPPSPWKLPIIGHMHHVIGIPHHHALRNLAQKHGPLMHFQVGENSSIIVSSPRLAKEIMKTHDLSFANRSETLVMKILFFDSSDITLTPYGDFWKELRKICTQELLGEKRVRSFGSIRQSEAMNMVESIKSLAVFGKLINLNEELTSYTSSMLCRSAFGNVKKDDHKAFSEILKATMPLARNFEIADIFPSFKILHPFFSAKNKMLKHNRQMDMILDKIIDQHVQNLAKTNSTTGESGEEDLVDVLLRVRRNASQEFPISDMNVKAILFDMFLGGSETSASIVEWVMSELIKNPNVMAKAQSEVRKAFAGKKTIEEADVQQLHYMKLVIKETLRLHPPTPLSVPKECREECEIDGYIIPVKTRIYVNIWALGRDPEYWDEPESFKPARFENSPVDFRGTHFEFLPFGGGRRICPGISFGLANVEASLAHLLYHFDWKLPGGLKPSDLDMAETLGFATTRKHDLCLLATAYDPSSNQAF